MRCRLPDDAAIPLRGDASCHADRPRTYIEEMPVGSEEGITVNRGSAKWRITSVVTALVLLLAACTGDEDAGTNTPGTDGTAGEDRPEAPTDPLPEVPEETFEAASGEASTFEFDGVSVSVAEGSIPDGKTVRVGASPGVKHQGERFGPTVSVEHEGFELADEVTVAWDLSELTKVERATMTVVRWSAEEGQWIPASQYEAEVSPAADSLTLQTWEFSFWSWVANTGQTVGEITGKRADAPSCADGELPRWVDTVVEPDLDTNAAPLRTCVEPDGETVTWRVTNNRTFAVQLELDDGYEFAWTWAGEDRPADPAWLGYRAVRSVVDGKSSFLVPPLTEVAVGIGRPDRPGMQQVPMTGRVTVSTVVADALVMAIEKLQLGDILGTGPVRDIVTTFYECSVEHMIAAGAPEESGQAFVAGLPSFLLAAVGDCTGQFLEGDGVADQMEDWASTGLPDEQRWKVHRKLFDLGRYFKILEAGDIAHYLGDQLQKFVVGDFVASTAGWGRPPQLGAWEPRCGDVEATSNRLYKNLALQDTYAFSSQPLHEHGSWADDAKAAIAPLDSCTTSQLRGLVDHLPGSWQDADAATELGRVITDQFELAEPTDTEPSTPEAEEEEPTGEEDDSTAGSDDTSDDDLAAWAEDVRGKVIRKDDGSAWFVDESSVRHRIPNGGTYLCLTEWKDKPVVDGVTSRQVQSLASGTEQSCRASEAFGKVIRRSDGASWYVDDEGTRHHVPDGGTYLCLTEWKGKQVIDDVSRGQVETFRSGGQQSCRASEAFGKVIRRSDGTSWYVDNNGTRHHIPNGGAYNCLVHLRGKAVINNVSRGQVQAFARGSDQVCRAILEGPDGTSFYVDRTGERHWIPDGGTYECIRDRWNTKVHKFSNWNTINKFDEDKDNWAACP